MLLLALGFYACQRERPDALVFKIPDYKKAEAFFDTRKDSAFYYFNKAAGGSKDSLQIAMAYNGMAELQSDAGDYFGSQESLATSLKYLDEQQKKSYRTLTADYNELGMTSVVLKNYDAAIGYYGRAFKFAAGKGSKATLLNNQANAYRKKKDYGHAIRLLLAAIAEAEPDGKTYARILTNLAFTRWLERPGYNAVPELLQALNIRRKEQDLWGQNASYAHLADYYALKRPDSALLYARAMYAAASRINSPGDRLEALQKLIKLAPARAARSYFLAYQELDDSMQTAHNAAKNQFALIRYEAEKNKADNLKLIQDNTEKNVLLYGTGALFVFLAGAAWLWYRKRKRRMAFDARQRELQLSQKVHDQVANGLYRVMKQIEHKAGASHELLGEIAELYERSRDISYEKPDAQAGFDEKVGKLLAGLAGAEVKLATAGNNAVLWGKVSTPVKRQLLYILQELMVNMRKHSQATGVTLSFKLAESRLHIRYTDNGKGFPQPARFGNGLNNTVSRMERIGGTITFEPSAGKGAKILIVLPV